MTEGKDYIGYKVCGFVLSMVPPIAVLDTADVLDRILLSLCGGLGALLAILGDRPKNWPDVVYRIVGGVISCFLFGPWMARRFGLDANFDGLILVFGCVGVSSWYVLGTVTKLIVQWQESGGLANAIKSWFRQWAGHLAPPAPPAAAEPTKAVVISPAQTVALNVTEVKT